MVSSRFLLSSLFTSSLLPLLVLRKLGLLFLLLALKVARKGISDPLSDHGDCPVLGTKRPSRHLNVNGCSRRCGKRVNRHSQSPRDDDASDLTPSTPASAHRA